MDAELFNRKFEIAQAAVEVYVSQPNDYFVHDVAMSLGTDSDDIYRYFRNRWEILDFYYQSLVTRYRLMTLEIEDYQDFSLAEKLSNFAYSSLGMLGEQKTFATRTFERLVLNAPRKSPLESGTEQLLRDFIEEDSFTGRFQPILAQNGGYSILAREFLHIVDFWLNDQSPHAETTQAFIDKWSRFIEELFYNKILDSGLDLSKYLMQNRMAGPGIAFLGDLFRTPFRRE